MPWEGGGARVITPEACVTVCLAVLEVIPDKAERTRSGTSCQVAGGFEERAGRGHPTPTTAIPPKQGRKLYPHPPCRIRACDLSKCRSRWWRSHQSIWRADAVAQESAK
jgi:hypothetical protein